MVNGMSEIDTALTLLQRREKNEQYFKTFHPEIYQTINGCALEKFNLSFIEKTGKLDLCLSYRSLYRGDARHYAEIEVNHFLNETLPEQISRYEHEFSAIPGKGQYNLPRFFYQHIEALLKEGGAPVSVSLGLLREGFLPHLTIVGVGLGFHIECLLEKVEVSSLAIYEDEIEVFAASLYTIDWFKIGALQQGLGKRISFQLGQLYHKELVYAHSWNALLKSWPAFPLFPCCYIHTVATGGCSPTDALHAFNKCIKDRPIFMSSWGSYDDEVNQVNQGVTNIRAGRNLLYEREHYNIPQEMPVCIVASGPSLDDRIESLRAMSLKSVVISCGSSITALFRHGIKPDIHLELESDHLMTTAYLDTIENADYLSSIPLLASLQLNPAVCQRFSRLSMFIKKESTLGTFPSEGAVVLDAGSPTCMNTGVRFAIKLGFKTIYLFGVDLGYQQGQSHHARSTAYHHEAAHPDLKSAGNLYNIETFKMPGVHGEVIVPKVLRLAHFRLENLIRDYQKEGFLLFNCSDGLAISGAQWLSQQQLEKISALGSLKALEVERQKKQVIDALFERPSEVVNPQYTELYERTLLEVKNSLETVSAEVTALFRQHTPKNCKQLTLVMHEIAHTFEYHHVKEHPMAYRLLKGSLIHFCYFGLAYALIADQGCDRHSKASQFIDHFKDVISHFFKILPRHFSNLFLDKEGSLSEQWAYLSIYDKEPGLERYLMP